MDMTTSPARTLVGFRRLCVAILALSTLTAALVAAPPSYAATTITVNTASQDEAANGVCSLREAIFAANMNQNYPVGSNDCIHDGSAGIDTIQFIIPGGGIQTIAPVGALPTITEPVIIDGTTQPGSSCATSGATAQLLIELDGTAAGAGVSGLTIADTADGSTIRGLVINRFSGNGILLQSDSNIVECNYIGTDPDGLVAEPNGLNGVRIEGGSNNRIGGTTPAARNVISANAFSGVFIWSNEGATPNSTGNLIQGNYIGANSQGASNMGNSTHGVLIENDNNIVGGSAAGAGNLIVDNGLHGVLIRRTPKGPVDPADGNRVEGNTISANGSRVPSAGPIGGGVAVTDASTGNVITRNAISDHTMGLGIDLGSDGPTANDGGDGDTGPNALQNFPVIASAQLNAAGALEIQYSVDSPTPLTVEFFRADSAVVGEGQTFLFDDAYSAAGPKTATLPGAALLGLADGDPIVATATSASNGTSEFSDAATLSRPAGAADLSTTSLSFGNVFAGSTTTQSVTVSNTGAGPLTVTGIAVSDDPVFTRSGGTCPTSFPALIPPTGCTIIVQFAPAASVAYNGTLTITDDDPGNAGTVSLSGTGVAATLTAGSTNFGDQLVGVASSAQIVATLTNPSDSALTITAIDFSAEFARSGGTCTNTLAAGASCTIGATFTPAGTGARSGTLTVTDSAPGSPRTVNLSGNGVVPDATPASLDFGSERVGATSAAQSATLTNPGDGPLTITGVTVSGDFTLSGGTCPDSLPDTLAAGASCTIEITFTPTITGTRNGTLSIADNAQGSPRTVALTGVGIASSYSSSPEPGAAISFTSLIGSSNDTTIVVSNLGDATLNVSAPSGVVAPFTVSPSTGYSIGAGAGTQTITITCAPTAAGPFTMNLSYTTDDPARPTVTYAVTCTGTTVATPGYGSTPAPGGSLNLGSAALGNAVTAGLTVRETGDATLTVSNPTISGANASDFSIVSPTTFPLNIANGGADQQIVVQCRPSGVGARSATLTLTTNDPARTSVSYSLSCTGEMAQLFLPLVVNP